MLRRHTVAAVIATVALGGSSYLGGPVDPEDCAAEGPSEGETTTVPVPVTSGTEIYGDGNLTPPVGFIGVRGPNGYLEAEGDAGSGNGNIRGTGTALGGELNGKLSADAANREVHLCLNDDDIA